MGTRLSIIVGRDHELALIGAALESARAGRGGAIFLVGEGGIGKSRLAGAAGERGSAAGMRLLRGRGSTVGPTVPFRSLTEALLSLVRVGDAIDVAALGPYRPILARLIPDWGAPPREQDGTSLVILAEAVLRVTALAAGGHGCLVTMEDLHDADPETLAVVDYLIDNLAGQPTLFLGAIRSDGESAALGLARAAGRRGSATVLELDRLSRADLRRMAGSYLDLPEQQVPEPAVDLVWAGSNGNPFLVEELLDDIADSGSWLPNPAGDHDPELPPTFVRGVGRRVESLGRQARQVLSIAAVLGSRFPLAVVRAVSGLPYRDLLNHLHSEVAAPLVAPDDHTPDWYVFRHSLIMDALLELLDPAERAGLAQQVADAIELSYPDLPGEWCQVCAALRLDAGQLAAAGRLFAEAGRRALALGAAQSAVALLGQAEELLVPDPLARADALETQLYALAEAGLIDRALATVDVLDQVGARIDRRRRARLHARLAWVANLDGRTVDGLDQVHAARALLGPGAAPEDIAPLDVVSAYLSLDLPGPGQLAEAESLARSAAKVAEDVPLPVVACQAWQLLGALLRPRDPDQATACLERSRSIAVHHDLPIWEIHALVRLGLDDALRDAGTDRLEQARDKASRIGAVTAQYQAEVNIALQAILRGEFAAAETLIDQVLAATTRLRLLEITQFMLVLRAVLAGHRGRRTDMDRALAELRQWPGDHSQVTPRVHGLARTFCALMEEDRDLARRELSTALLAQGRNPTTIRLAGREGLNLLLLALAGELDWAEYRSVSAEPAAQLRWDRQFALFARAVLTGRDGDPAAAAAAVDEALLVGSPYSMSRHLGLRLVAEAALADGWGTPVEWLRAAEEYFHGLGVTAVAGACRALLRRTGYRVAQRRTGFADIPWRFRSVGITLREYEVLRLLVGRLGNREIAGAMHLSQRTVEKHVSSLIAKTGLPNRVELAKFAATTE
ncbi:ATP-binding protein [Actinokineospora sp.]|uniref:ATP-binding protein n=1 Tax=Actinokineospora sp. TaxID=1872133 RepID=UPI0040377459